MTMKAIKEWALVGIVLVALLLAAVVVLAGILEPLFRALAYFKWMAS